MARGERALIAAFEELLANRSDRVVRWVGDDAAVVRARPVAGRQRRHDGRRRALPPRPPARRIRRTRAGARWPARCPTSRRWAPTPARPTSRMGIPEGFGADAATQCVRGMEALAAETGVTICGGDVTRGAGADARGDRRRLGRRRGRRSWGATARGRATASASPGRSAQRPPDWRCSTAAPTGRTSWSRAYLRPRPRLARGTRAGARRRARADRPQRRHRHRRRAPRAAQRRAHRDRPRGAAAGAGRRRGRRPARRAGGGARRDGRRGLRAVRGDGPGRRRPRASTWVGRVTEGPPELSLAGAGGRPLAGYEHAV